VATGDLALAETSDGGSSGPSARRGHDRRDGRTASERMARAGLVILARLLARQAASEALQAADHHGAEPAPEETTR
jgi:hypothetical protein